MENIFENAYFGKAYKTKSEDKVILVSLFDDRAYLIIKNPIDNSQFGHGLREYRLDGVCKDCQDLDIVSEWQETVDEDRLNAILDEAEEMRETAIGRQQTGGWYWRRWAEWGYRKAKEE